MSVLELACVTRRYDGGEGGVQALRGVDLQIEAGEFVAIVGPSGCGKSTLLNILGCLDRPSTGSCRVLGAETVGMDADDLAQLRCAHIGFVFQRYNLLPRLDAQSNVELAAVYAGHSRQARRSRAIELLSRLGLGERLTHRPNELSGGQQQRVSIARALMNGAELILADEPTGALDSRSGRALLEVLRECTRSGSTVIVVTHDPAVAAVADRRIEMSDGRIVRDSGDQPREATGTQHSGEPGRRRRPASAAMALFEAASSALRTILANRLRAGLTTIGVAIGIAAVTAIVAIAQGEGESILAVVGDLAKNSVTVRRGRTEHDPNEDAIRTLGVRDMRALVTLPGVIGVIPAVSSKVRMRHGNRDITVDVTGIDTQGLRLEPATLAAGREVGSEDVARARDVIILSEPARKRLFEPGSEVLGRTVLAGNLPCTVIGVTARQTNIESQLTLGGERAWIPYSTLLTRMLGRDYFDGFAVILRPDTDSAQAEGQIIGLLERLHGRRDFYTWNVASFFQTFSQVARINTLVLGLVGGISLLVGGVGVMNIMLVAVAERTHEIGIRMAVGARPVDIGRQFLIESVCLCTLGGLAGLALAVLICAGVSAASGLLHARVSPLAVLIAFITCLIIGVLFGWLPARKAARLDPVVALARE